MDWDKLRIFHTVYTSRSFTRAGETLNLSQSAISRQVSALEEDMAVALFHRHARGLVPTEQGEILYQAVGDIFSRLAAAESAMLDSKERPQGPLKITVPTAIGTMWLVPHLKEFCDLYPEISITLIATDNELDLTKREADVAMRLTPAKHPDLVQKQLTSIQNALYASQSYLNAHGVPAKEEDLANHRLITYADASQAPFDAINWVLKRAKKRKKIEPFMQINSVRGIFKAVEAGIGIASLPDYMVRNNPQLIRVLPELNGTPADVYYIYPMELRNSKRVRFFKEFLIRKLAEDGLGGLV